MAGSVELYIDNTNYVEALLTDPKNDNAPVVDANPVITITEPDGTPIVGANWPLDLNNRGMGFYDRDIAKGLVLVELTAYVGHIVDNAKGIDVRLPYVAVYRTGTKYSQERLDWISTRAGTL